VTEVREGGREEGVRAFPSTANTHTSSPSLPPSLLPSLLTFRLPVGVNLNLAAIPRVDVHDAPLSVTLGQDLGSKHDLFLFAEGVLPDFLVGHEGIDSPEEHTLIFNGDVHTGLMLVGGPSVAEARVEVLVDPIAAVKERRERGREGGVSFGHKCIDPSEEHTLIFNGDVHTGLVLLRSSSVAEAGIEVLIDLVASVFFWGGKEGREGGRGKLSSTVTSIRALCLFVAQALRKRESKCLSISSRLEGGREGGREGRMSSLFSTHTHTKR